MSSQAVLAAKQEIGDAIADAEPVLRGLEDLAKVSISATTLAAVQAETARIGRRAKRLKAALAALDELAGDGYPETLNAVAPSGVLDELRGQLEDVADAVGVFVGEAPAIAVKVDLGKPSKKAV